MRTHVTRERRESLKARRLDSGVSVVSDRKAAAVALFGFGPSSKSGSPSRGPLEIGLVTACAVPGHVTTATLEAPATTSKTSRGSNRIGAIRVLIDPTNPPITSSHKSLGHETCFFIALLPRFMSRRSDPRGVKVG